MNTKYILTSTVVGTAILLGSVAPTLAQTATPNSRPEKRCEAVNARIDNRIIQFDRSKANIITRQEKINERLAEFINGLESKGYDVSTVRGDLETMKGMVTTSDSDYTALINQLKETKQLDCGDSKGVFKQAVEEAKTVLAKFRADVKTITDFVKNTLRPDLKALKGQNPGSTTSE